ncbi:MAG: chemotaxis protein CheD [Neomegalonema sp.]|nr:chemotaxis protein CheD [Neomegalonema sp.]
MMQSKPYWEAKIDSFAQNVLPGDCFVTERTDLAVVTLLGSCVAACIRDTSKGIGGLNHFLLPEGKGADSGSARYGAFAMEVLVNSILRAGGRRSDLEAKVFGGGRVIASSAGATVGDRNGAFVLNYLRREGIRVAASDLGGPFARRVFYFPATGRVVVQRIDRSEAAAVIETEKKVTSVVVEKVEEPDVELFI